VAAAGIVYIKWIKRPGNSRMAVKRRMAQDQQNDDQRNQPPLFLVLAESKKSLNNDHMIWATLSQCLRH